ncbi:MAG: SGNH hydrolase domain-containing protein, partial [Verrucomicrobiales bacterium]
MNGALWESTLREIERVRPTQLVLACHWDKLGRDPNRLKATLERLKPLVSRQIILMTMPPDRPKNASREAIRAGARPPFYEAPDKRAFRQQLDRLAKDLADAKVQVLETAPFFVDADGSVPVFNEAGQPLFFDRLHLSKVGTDRLKPTLTRMLTQRP